MKRNITKRLKRIGAAALALTLVGATAVPAFAADDVTETVKVYANEANGDQTVEVGTITTDGGGIEATANDGKTATVTSKDIDVSGKGVYLYSSGLDASGNKSAIKCTVNGTINTKGGNYAVEARAYDGGSTQVDVNGTVQTKNDYPSYYSTAYYAQAKYKGSSVTGTLTGDIVNSNAQFDAENGGLTKYTVKGNMDGTLTLYAHDNGDGNKTQVDVTVNGYVKRGNGDTGVRMTGYGSGCDLKGTVKGDVSGSTGIYLYPQSGSADLKVTGNVTSWYQGIYAEDGYSGTDNKVKVWVDGSVDVLGGTMNTPPNAIYAPCWSGAVDVHVGSDLNSVATYGVYAQAGRTGTSTVDVGGDINAKSGTDTAISAHLQNECDKAARVTVGGTVNSEGGGAILYASQASTGEVTVAIDGDLNAKREAVSFSNDSGKDPTLDLLTLGTIEGKEKGILLRSDPSEKMKVTAWRIVPVNGVVAGYNTDNGYTPDETFEKNNINYIIKVKQPNDTNPLYVTDEEGNPLATREHKEKTYELAKERERIYLQADDHYTITAAYNGETALDKDENGFYLDVPKGGGVYLSAVLEPKTYDVTFYDEGGTDVLYSDKFAYGETPVYPYEDPTKPETEDCTFTFDGWSPEITKVTGDAEYTAIYTTHTHEWQDATCTEPKTCTGCGKTVGEALGHKWKAATCTEPKTCTVCEETEGEALGHSWDNGKITKKPTCTMAGVKTYTCTACEATKTESIKATGHKWKAATCTRPRTCAVCGKTEGKALGHKWKAATCTKPKTCAVCGKTEGKALGHKWKAATCTKPKTCAVCGATVGKAKGHKWGPWKVTKKPTPTTPGEKRKICKNDSSHIHIVKIPPTGKKVSGTLLTKMTAKGKNGFGITWTKITGADGYDVFLARCNHTKSAKDKWTVKSFKGNNTFSWTKTGLKKHTSYKVRVKAWVTRDGKKKYVSASPTAHGYTGGYRDKYTNPKSVTVSKTKISLKVRKTYMIKAKVTKLKKNLLDMPASHAPKLRYLSTDSKVATVNGSGKITAKAKGTCKIYVYAVNGVSRTVTVTVK